MLKKSAVFLIFVSQQLSLIWGQVSVNNSSCWNFMVTIPRIRQFTARIAAAAPSVQRKLQLDEFKFTIFAYTNEAYVQAIGDGYDEQLSQSDTVKYHIYGGGVDSSNRIELNDFYWRDIDQTLLSLPVFASQMVDSDPTELYETQNYYVNGARVVESWTNSSSCYVYAIDRVLLPIAKPQSIYGFLQSAENNLSILNDFIDIVASSDPSILSTLKQLRLGTAFLPSDDAFAKLEPGMLDRIKANPAEAKKTLLAHFSFSSTYFTGKLKPGTLYPMEYSVIQGISASEPNQISYNGARIKLTHADIALSNGVVHLIDSVLTPPNDDLATSIGKLENLSKFAFLISSDVNARDLLASSTRYTVFAPIDAAVGDVARFRNDDSLDSLLKGLIVRGQFATSNLKQLVSVDEMVLPFASFLTSVSGTRLNIVKIHNDLFISDGSSMARIIRGYSDIAASNGIVHYVDAFVGRPGRGVFDTINSFGSNLNSTANSLRQLGYSDVLGISNSNTKSGQKAAAAKKWWVMFVPIESSWQSLHRKKGANALLRNRLAMSRVWRRHIFYSEIAFADADDGTDDDAGFIRPANLTAVNDLLSTRHLNSNDDGDVITNEHKVAIVETTRNNYQLQSGDESYKILFSNIGCSNGVVHIIDRLMLVDDDPVAELNIGNPRIVGAQLTLGLEKVGENASRLSTSYDDYGSTVDTFSPLGPVDLTQVNNASITFAVDCGDYHNISNLGNNNLAPLPAFSFVVPELDVKYANIFSRNTTNLDQTNRKLYKYSFTKRQLAENGLCDIGVNPVASAIPGHHQGRAYINFTFHYGPFIMSIGANVSARGCLFTCNIATCPANRPLRVLWAFTTDETPASDDSDEAFALGNVASNNRQFYLDTLSCGRMVTSVTGDLNLRQSFKVSCRASTLAATDSNNPTTGRDFATQTAIANFFEVVTNGRSR